MTYAKTTHTIIEKHRTQRINQLKLKPFVNLFKKRTKYKLHNVNTHL